MIKNITTKIMRGVRENGFSYLLKVLFVKHIHYFKPFMSPVFFESVNMYLRHGYWPNIKKPRSLNEKIVYQKLFVRNPLFAVVADKVQVRKYVADKVDSKILNKLLFVGDDPHQIPFDSLPSKFVVKTNHGSGWNIIVRDKASIDRNEIIRTCNYWLGLKYSDYSKGYEAHYDNIPPLVLVEKFLDGLENKPVLDYKFFCFNGVVRFVAVDTDKQKKQSRYIFDKNWNLLPFRWPNFPQKEPPPKPVEINRMVSIAEALSKDFEFCRVDLYLSNDGVKFGEITISPGGGWDKITPRTADFDLGALWKPKTS